MPQEEGESTKMVKVIALCVIALGLSACGNSHKATEPFTCYGVANDPPDKQTVLQWGNMDAINASVEQCSDGCKYATLNGETLGYCDL